MASASGPETLRSVLEAFLGGIVGSIPKLLSGLLFLVVAYFVITAIKRVVHAVVGRMYPDDQQLVVDLVEVVVGLFLWFGAGLTLLDIVGLGQIAASLGTAAGFVALGVSYALSNMLADTVAGVYLLRDRDFNPGDQVTVDSTTGTVRDIGLRKSRIETAEGDTVVLANRDVDKKWTKAGTE